MTRLYRLDDRDPQARSSVLVAESATTTAANTTATAAAMDYDTQTHRIRASPTIHDAYLRCNGHFQHVVYTLLKVARCSDNTTTTNNPPSSPSSSSSSSQTTNPSPSPSASPSPSTWTSQRFPPSPLMAHYHRLQTFATATNAHVPALPPAIGPSKYRRSLDLILQTDYDLTAMAISTLDDLTAVVDAALRTAEGIEKEIQWQEKVREIRGQNQNGKENEKGKEKGGEVCDVRGERGTEWMRVLVQRRDVLLRQVGERMETLEALEGVVARLRQGSGEGDN